METTNLVLLVEQVEDTMPVGTIKVTAHTDKVPEVMEIIPVDTTNLDKRSRRTRAMTRRIWYV